MRQQVIYSMMAMAVAPAFSYAAITSAEAAAGITQTGVGTSEKVCFENIDLVPGKYKISATWTNKGKAFFTVYDGATSVATATGEGELVIKATGTYTIKVKATSGTVGVENPKLNLQFDWTDDNTAFKNFKASVLDYIGDISDYETPDKDTNVDLNTCKQVSQDIDWAELVSGKYVNRTYANYATYKLYAFSGVALADGEESLLTMFADAKKAINGAEADIWLDKAQTLLDNFKAGGAVYDKVAALQADGAELEYADVLGLEDNSKWEEAAKNPVSVKTLATELLAAFAADGGEQKAVQDFYDEINADKEATINATEFKKKIVGDGTGELEKAVKLALDKATLLEGLQKWMVDAGVPSAEGLVKFEELVDEFDAALATMPIVSERSCGVWRHAASRLRGQVYKVQVAIEKALAVYTEQLAADVPTWKNPKGFTVSVPKITIDGTDYGSKNYTISSMGTSVLGLAEADPAAHYYTLKDANYTIRHGIAFMKWFKINNVQAYDDAVEAVDKAKKKYNKEIQRLELEIQKLDALDPNTSANNDQYAELLENAKTALLPTYKDVLDTYYKEEDGTITGTIYETRKAGGDIGTQTTNLPQTFYLNADASARVNNAGDARVPSEVWQDEIATLTTGLAADVDAWIAKAQAAYDRFKDLNTLVNGVANDGELKHDLAATGFSAIPAELQKQTVYTDLKAQNDKIEADIQALGEALTEANKTLNETGDDMAINDEGWDKTNADSKFWNKMEVTDPEFVTYAEIGVEIATLKAAVEAAVKEYNAWQKLLADADDLANRLKTASEALTDYTKNIQNPAYNPADYYGYKGIGDDAAQNTKMAKMITDYVAALKDKANEAYGDGNGTGAQTLLAETDAYTDNKTTVLSADHVTFVPTGENDTNTDITAAALAAGKYKLGISLIDATAGGGGMNGTFMVVVKTASATFGSSAYYEITGNTAGTVWFELTQAENITVEIENVSNYDAGQDATFEFTLTKADGSTYGYQDTPLVDTDKDADTDPDFTWKLADQDIKLLEAGGDIEHAVKVWEIFRSNVAADQAEIVDFFNQEIEYSGKKVKVNEHGIYTDDNHWYDAPGTGNNDPDKHKKYQTEENVWKDYIKTNGTDVIETNQALDAKDHFDAIAAADYTVYNPQTKFMGLGESDDVKPTIAAIMLEYDQNAQLKLATDLNDQLAGTDGYIAEAQQAWQDAFDEVYTNDADFWTKYDADTQVWGTNPITGNTGTLEDMWNAMKDAIDQVETDRQAIEPDLDTSDDAKLANAQANASDSWNALSALKKQLDMFTSSEEAEGEPTVANCIAKLKEYTERIKEGLKLNYDTYKELVNADPDNLGTVNQLYKAIGEHQAKVIDYVFIAANGETLDYESKYQDLENNYAVTPVENVIQGAYEDFYNFALVEYDEAAKEWKATALYDVSETKIAEAYVRLEVLDEYVETYDEYLHVNTALNGNATITAAIAEYAKKYGNPDGAFTELASDDDVYGTAAARANFEAMLTDLNTASGKTVANLTGEEANLKDIEALLGSDRTAFDKDDFDKAGLLLSKMLETLEKLGGLTAAEGENYSTFKGESMAERKYDFLIQGILEQAKDNQNAYDNILDMKQKLSDAVKKALEQLAAQEDVSYEDENGNTVDPKADLIKDIQDNYEPLPTNMAAAILASYEAGASVAQDYDDPDPADAADRQYYKLKKAYDELATKLADWASEGYAAAIAAKNQDIYTDQISALYLQAMEKYNKAVADVKEFKTPEYQSLKEAYETEILVLNNGLYTAPEKLLAARKTAQDNRDAASTATPMAIYDATADVAAIQAIIDDVIKKSFDEFISAMQNAAQDAWDLVKTDLQAAIDAAKNEVETEGYFASLNETKNAQDEVETQAGVPYADAAAIAALFQAQQDIWNAADELTDLDDAGNPAYGEFLKLDRMLTGNVQAGEEALAAIEPGVKTKLNEVANTDLTVRAQLVNGAALIANTVLGDKAIMEGKGAVVSYNGKDYQYTYQEAVEALAETTGKDWKSFTDRFDALVAATYTAAVTLQKTYNDAEQLPSATIDEVLTNTRGQVIDLLALFDGGNAEIESFATIIGEIETIYNQYTGDMAYNVELAALEEDFATEAAGIKDLYVGELFVDALNTLEAAIAAEKKSKTNLPTVNDLRAELNLLVANAKAAERSLLATELAKMEGEYNDLIGNVYKDDAAKKEELIAKFATDADPAAIDQLNIEENENQLAVYNETTPYEKYLEIETNLALIKTEIGKEIAAIDPTNELAVTDEMLADMVSTLEAAIAACEDYESEFIAGQKLLDPKNPEMDEEFYLEDFGLYSYYLDADYQTLLEEVEVDKEALAVIKANLAKYKEAGTILLYNEKLTNELETAKASLKGADNAINNPDNATSLYAKNKAELEKAAVWNQIYKEQQALIDAFATFDDEGELASGTLKDALDRIEELGESWTTTPTLATVLEGVENLQKHLDAMYLAGKLSDTYTVNTNRNARNLNYYKDGTAVSVVKVNGLNYWNNMTTAAVDAAALKHAQKQLADVTAVYDAVEEKLNNTKMRAADKEAMLLKLAGFKAELDDLALTGGKWQGEDVALTDANVDDYDAAVAALKDKLATDISVDPETGDLIVEGGFVDEIEAELVGDLNSGDGTGDGVVDVDDLDILLGYVTDGIPADDPNYDKIFAAADLNNDKVIDISDALILIDMITNQDVSEYVQARSAEGFTETATATVESVSGNRQRIAISLNNWRQYAAFQMDVQLPKGMTIVGQELSDRASGKTMLIGQPNGKTRFVAYDMEKTALTGNNGAVLYIDVETNDSFRGGDIKYSNIIFATTESVGVRFYIGDSETTGIRTTKLDAAKQTIYNIGGRVMDSLKKGVNILRGDNGDTQKVIKK